MALAIGATADRSCRADEPFSLVVDPFTGTATLRNDGPATVNLDGYYLTSGSTPVFNTAMWNSLQDQSKSGWQEASSPAGNRMGEVNLFESIAIPAGGELPIGQPYTPVAPAEFGQREPGLGTMNFSYTLDGETAAHRGDVEFSSRNTVVLVIEPQTGAASLVNQSSYDIEIDGYLVTSKANALNTSGWAPLSQSDPDWTSSIGAANRIAEGNLLDATPLAANGGSVDLGTPIDPALLVDEGDLSLEFSVAGLSRFVGGVLFEPLAVSSIPGDFNRDGSVSAADFTVWRDALGSHHLLNNNGDETGASAGIVDLADYELWKANFGAPVFGAEVAAAVPIPEPAACLVSCLLFTVPCLARRRCRSA
jgi:hypothetical protein